MLKHPKYTKPTTDNWEGSIAIGETGNSSQASVVNIVPESLDQDDDSSRIEETDTLDDESLEYSEW